MSTVVDVLGICSVEEVEEETGCESVPPIDVCTI
jgi:hypothetical protein